LDRAARFDPDHGAMRVTLVLVEPAKHDPVAPSARHVAQELDLGAAVDDNDVDVTIVVVVTARTTDAVSPVAGASRIRYVLKRRRHRVTRSHALRRGLIVPAEPPPCAGGDKRGHADNHDADRPTSPAKALRHRRLGDVSTHA